MRVLLLTQNCAGLGGSFMRAWSLGRALARAGLQITLAAGRAAPGVRRRQTKTDGVTLWEAADFFPHRVRHGGLSPLDVLARVALIRRGGFDVVYGFELRPAVILPALLRPEGTFVSDWSDLWGDEGFAAEAGGPFRRMLGRWDGSAERRLRPRADGVVAISRFLASRAEALGLPAARVQVVGVGANGDLLAPAPTAAARVRYGLATDRPVAVHIGFASHDVFFLAETLAAMVAAEPRLTLVCAGRRHPAFTSEVARLGLTARVRHVGVVSYRELAWVLACGDVMLMPLSDCPINRARVPNRFGDYLAAGRPVATTAVGDLAKVVADEHIGRATAATPAAFAAGALELLADPARHDMGIKARRLAETSYSWDAIAAPLPRFFRGLAADGSVTGCRGGG